MQLTTELVISIIASVGSGAMMAWLGNRVMNAEILGHVKRHCLEIDNATKLAERAHEMLGDHREWLARIDERQRRRDG